MLKITLRGIRAHVARLVLTALVVLMGVSFIVSVQVLTDTQRDGVADAFTEVGKGIDAVVRSTDTIPSQFGGPPKRAPVADDVLAVARTSPGARLVVGAVSEQTRLIGPDGTPIDPPIGGGPLLALNWIDDPQLSQWHIVDGAAPTGERDVVIDAGIAEDRGLAVGSSVSVPAAAGAEAFRVSGIARFGTARNYQGASAALFATPTAQRLFVAPGKFTFLLASATPGTTSDELVASLRRTIGVNRQAQVLSGEAWLKETADAISQILAIVNSFLQAFGYVGLFVATFIIYNTFSIVVAQRSRELALLRALGASRRQVVGAIGTEAVVVGAVASAGGVAAGIGLGAGVSALLVQRGLVPPDAPLAVRPTAYLPAYVVGVVVTVIASWWPARRASRIPPVAALRETAVEQRRATRRRLLLAGALTGAGAGAMALGLTTDIPSRTNVIWLGMAGVFLGVAGLGPAIVPWASRVLGRPIGRWRGITARLAWENAARSPKRSSATAAAVMIGVALVSLIAILGESFRATTTDAIDSAVRADFVVNTGAVGLKGVSPELTRQLAAVPGVEAAAGLRAGVARVELAPSLVFGIDPTAFPKNIRFDVTEGNLAALGNDGVAITADEAKEKGWSVGTRLKASFLQAGDRMLTVRAVFTSELLRGTSGYFVDLRLYASVFPASEQTDFQIYVKLAEGADPAAVRPALDAAAKRFPPCKIEDLTQFKATRTKPIDNFVFFLWALLALAVVISMLGIVNTLLLNVVERTREIGLLRAGGMTRQQVRATVRWEAVLLSVIGAALGIAVGTAFAAAIVRAFHDEGLTSFALPYGQLLTVLVVAGAAGVLAALWPARRAARLDVLRAIAHE